MTLKSAFTNADDVAFVNIQETHGGQNIDIRFSIEMMELVKFWREWGPVFKSYNPSVIDALNNAKVLHEITK
jgi:hypothetical protein